MSSLIVPDSLQITLYTGEYYTGTSWNIVGPAALTFNDDRYKGWNDNVRSIVVSSISSESYSFVGYWSRVASGNADLKKSVTVGSSLKEGSVFTNSMSFALTAAAEAGCDFLGTGGKVKMSSTLALTFTSVLTQSLEQS